MRFITPLLLSITLFSCSGCATWQDSTYKTLQYADRVGTGMAQTALPLVTLQCKAEVASCEAMEDPDCPRWHKCNDVRSAIVRSLVALKFAIIDVDAALSVGDEKSADDAIRRVTEIILDIRKQMKEVGLS